MGRTNSEPVMVEREANAKPNHVGRVVVRVKSERKPKLIPIMAFGSDKLVLLLRLPVI